MAGSKPADIETKLDPDPVLAPLAIMTPAIALMVTLPFMFVYAAIAAGIALVGAVVVGAPVLSSARRLGLRGLILTSALGAVTAGLTVFAVAAVMAMIYGSLVQVNPDGALLAVTVGAATGATYATIYDSVDLSPTKLRWRIMIIVLVAVMIPFVALAVQK